MSVQLNFLFLVTVLVYLAASIFQTLSLAIGNRTEASVIRPSIDRIAFWGTILGFAMLTLFIIFWWLWQGRFPMTDWTDSIALFAWAITLIYLIIIRLTHLRALGSFVMPVAFFSILISYSFPRDTSATSELLENYWVIPHVTLIIIGFASFIAAFGFALMYLIAERKIRAKTHMLFHNLLPPLGISDELGYLCIIFGVILLTIGVIVGSVLKQYMGELSWKDPKIISTLVTWLIYVVQIGIRQFWGWRGRKAAYASIIGFIAVLCTYVGVEIFLESMHEF